MSTDGQGREWAPSADPQTKNQCQRCGSFVTPDFARVFGNNDDEVFGCYECMDRTAVRGVGAASGDVS